MANLAGITLKWINQNEIIIDNIDSDNVEMKNDNSKDKIISLQDETIKLQKEKIEALEKQLKEKIEALETQLNDKSLFKNPANHFEIRGKHSQKTDTWYDAKISGLMYLCSVFQNT